MFEFYCDVLLGASNTVASALPDFPTLLEYNTVDAQVLTYLDDAYKVISYVLPVSTLIGIVGICEAVLHYRTIKSCIHTLKFYMPFYH